MYDPAEVLARRYKIIIEPLSEADGGGWFAEIPALPGCGSDGESPQEALENVLDAKRGALLARIDLGRSMPEGDGTVLVHRALLLQALAALERQPRGGPNDWLPVDAAARSEAKRALRQALGVSGHA